jgi:hypothetical protein
LSNSFFTVGDEAEHAEGQDEEQDESAQLARLRLPGKLADDEQHVEHEGAQPEGHAELCQLLLGNAEHRGLPRLLRQPFFLPARLSARLAAMRMRRR